MKNGLHLGGLFLWLFGGVHIRFFCNGHLGFRSYSGSLSKSAKVTKALLPRHSVPRLGSACPHSGITPGARRHRPSMAGGGYRGILAAVPPAQYLRSASGKGAVDPDPDPDPKPKPKPKQKPQQDQKIAASLRSTAPTGKCVHVRSGRPVGRLAFDFDAPPHREAEWRFCAVGNPAWMPG